ncbi:glycoside hydrolase family 2 protein [Microlunatus capsulatus]|uniref:beta-mannosidase n=1 Tax=Microlunatus capsulatus TaxID=99117 RepID=A0ABS4Z5W9_9ACTN|nr:glycoside hydrolase family 2 protein [Microlunatus capsulatus]MBP2416354.1 beta-mannosidase [Microlunatus capsulatus]
MTANPTPATPRALRRTSLDSVGGTAWTLTALDPVPAGWAAVGEGPVAATVPGEVHAELLAAGLIPDPFDADHEAQLAWIGRTSWSYRAELTWTGGPEDHHELVADGLDTLATVLVNGTEVARTANEHRTHRVDVTDVLVEGTNTLEIRFEAPVTGAERLAAELGDRPRAYGHPFNALRKMASQYGWDWGPDLAGAGIWKSIGIESWSGVRLAAVRPLATLDGTDGVLETHVDLQWAPGATEPVTVAVRLGGDAAQAVAQPGQPSVVVVQRAADVAAWWPRGYGAQALHDVAVEVAAGTGRLGTWSGRVGFRTVTLTTEPDVDGTGFVLAVNGEPVFVKGANWIPDDALVTRLTEDTYRAGVAEAVAAGMNLLRVWGGGIYESEHFYRACDEAGVLVWQDFLFACAAYSEDEPLRSEVVAEAREAVTRLSQHASLVLWNGNNENIWGYVEWGWRTALAGRSWGDGYYTEVLPAVVAELDPRTPYSPGSPYSFVKYAHPNDHRHGTMHIWDVWNQRDYSHYRDYPARFVSEFGFQGPAAWSTLTSVVHDEPLDPYGPQMLVHQKAHLGNLKLERGLGEHLPGWGVSSGPGDATGRADMDDWHWLTSLNQARAVAFGVEHFRSLYPLNRGAVVWQLNDNWPVVSWAAVDSHGIRKPLWYALRRVNADRFATFQPRPDEHGEPVHTLVAHDDSDEVWEGELVLTRRSTGAGSTVLAEQRVPFHLDPRSAVAVVLDADLLTPADPRAEVLTAEAEGMTTAFGYFVEDTELQLVDAESAYEVEVAHAAGGCTVTVTAAALAKDLMLFPDRLDPAARVDSGLVTLLAGQSHTFAVTGPALDDEALTTKPVLRSVNDVVGQ